MNIASGFNGNQSTLTGVFVLKAANARALFQSMPGQPDNISFDCWEDYIDHACDTSASVDTSKIPSGGIITFTCNRNANNNMLLSSYSNGLQFDGPRVGDTNTVYISGAVLGTNNQAAFFNGDLCEMLIYNHVLSSADKQSVETYLAGKYGLTVNEEQPPTVSITAPANNAQYTAPATVTITATATASAGSISEVAFYNGTTLLGTTTSSPYSYIWTNVAAGNYTLIAQAYDSAGAETLSTPVSITVNASTQCATPTFNPVAGTYGSAQTVTISTTTGGASINYTTNGTTPSSKRSARCTAAR